MAFQFAGLFAEAIFNTAGRPQPNLDVTVYTDAGATTLATLWTSRLKAAAAPNPATSSDLGNLEFFVDPGVYYLRAAGETDAVRVEVDLDPEEPDADIATHSADTTAVHGIADSALLLTTSSVLSALADVDATVPALDDALLWDGNSWGPGTIAGFDEAAFLGAAHTWEEPQTFHMTSAEVTAGEDWLRFTVDAETPRARVDPLPLGSRFINEAPAGSAYSELYAINSSAGIYAEQTDSDGASLDISASENYGFISTTSGAAQLYMEAQAGLARFSVGGSSDVTNSGAKLELYDNAYSEFRLWELAMVPAPSSAAPHGDLRLLGPIVGDNEYVRFRRSTSDVLFNKAATFEEPVTLHSTTAEAEAWLAFTMDAVATPRAFLEPFNDGAQWNLRDPAGDGLLQLWGFTGDAGIFGRAGGGFDDYFDLSVGELFMVDPAGNELSAAPGAVAIAGAGYAELTVVSGGSGEVYAAAEDGGWNLLQLYTDTTIIDMQTHDSSSGGHSYVSVAGGGGFAELQARGTAGYLVLGEGTAPSINDPTAAQLYAIDVAGVTELRAKTGNPPSTMVLAPYISQVDATKVNTFAGEARFQNQIRVEPVDSPFYNNLETAIYTSRDTVAGMQAQIETVVAIGRSIAAGHYAFAGVFQAEAENVTAGATGLIGAAYAEAGGNEIRGFLADAEAFGPTTELINYDAYTWVDDGVTVANYYGLRLPTLDMGAGAAVTNRWGVYQEDPAANNLFAGNATFRKNITAEAVGSTGFGEFYGHSDGAELYMETGDGLPYLSVFLSAADARIQVESANGSAGLYADDTHAWLGLLENATDVAAPAANNARLFAKDDGAGNTLLAARFPTGDPIWLGPMVRQVDRAGAAHTLGLADISTVQRMTNAGASTVTVPLNATTALPIGTVINVYAAGAGGTTIAGETGAVLIRNNTLPLVQYQEVSLRKDGTNEWVRAG